MLAVNARNLAAMSLYLKAGFIDEGALFHGPIGDQHILTFHIRQTEG
jgi:RimJ/RimL family protein N-acetyltransferase